jgi:nuclear cap-binding protein subunit 2
MILDTESGVLTTTVTKESAPDNATIPANSLLSDLPRAPELLFGNSTADKKLYWDRSHYDSPESQMKALEKSSTLYIGNMAFSTRSMPMRSHFSQIGAVKSVHMGLDRFRRTPCGFGFVEYYDRRDALEAVASLTGTKLDGRVIRVELDAGFQPGRELGRGASGGQVRDDRRGGLDPARSKRDTVPGSRQQDSSDPSEKPEREDSYTGLETDRPAEQNPRFREE